jgi:hypothetical protein
MLAMAGVLLSVRIRPAESRAGGGVSEHGDCSTGVGGAEAPGRWVVGQSESDNLVTSASVHM